MIFEKHDPTDRIKLVTIIKITNCNVYHHYQEGKPYVQISTNVEILDGAGGTKFACIEESASYDDHKTVRDLVSLYTHGSLFWVECQAFSFNESGLTLYNPETIQPLATEDIDEINQFFLHRFPSDREPQEQTDLGEITTSDVNQDMDNCRAIMSGYLEHLETVFIRSGRKMAYAKFHDENNKIDLIIFANVFEDYEKALLSKNKIVVTGRLDVSEYSSYLIPERFDFARS
jgi:hypothetical protein